MHWANVESLTKFHPYVWFYIKQKSLMMRDKDFSEESSRRMQIFALERCLGALTGRRASICSVKASLINIHMKARLDSTRSMGDRVSDSCRIKVGV